MGSRRHHAHESDRRNSIAPMSSPRKQLRDVSLVNCTYYIKMLGVAVFCFFCILGQRSSGQSFEWFECVQVWSIITCLHTNPRYILIVL